LKQSDLKTLPPTATLLLCGFVGVKKMLKQAAG
jgi:hypothetical protein